MEFFGGMLDTRFLIGFAFIAALVLAGGLVWHRFGAGPLKAMTPRGRQPRLAVIEATSLHPGRLLVLIRRDNTEHLIMIGGPTDVVIEPNIARGGAGAGAGGAARESRAGPVADVPARLSPLDDRPGWPPPIEPPLRVARPLDPLLGEPERLEPPLRAPRESVPVEAVARMTRTEPVVRAPPPVPAEQFLAEFDDDASDEPALIPPPPPAPAPPQSALVSEPRRPQVQPVPPPPAYEPSFQPALAPERRPAALAPPPPPLPPSVAPPVETPAFQRAPEPRRMAARPMPAPPPPPPPPPEPPESALEAAWMQASTAPPTAQDLDQPAARHSPVLQSTVMTEARRPQTVPPKPMQNDESNLAEMAQRLEAALRRPIKPVEPAPPPVSVRAPPAAPAANPAARVAAYFDPPATTRSAAGRAQEPPPAPVLKVVPAQEKAPSLEEEMASLLGRSQGKT
jgi:flagellar protein FliO/FliZ